MSSSSPDVRSVVGSPVWVELPPSVFSDIENSSLSENTSDKLGSSSATGNTAAVPSTAPVHPKFSFSDANIEVETPRQLFWVHEYHLNKFSVMARLIQEARNLAATSNADRSQRIKIFCDGDSEDFVNTFRVVYDSNVFDQPEWDSVTLISTLRIATVYSNHSMRNYAITQLESQDLPAIKRVQLSDELHLPSWETKAFTELCRRAEPISQLEGVILGMERVIEIARIREADRRHGFIEACDWPVEPSHLFQSDGTVKEESIESDAEVSSKHKSLPDCTCRGQATWASPIPQRVITCSLHKIAPNILAECHIVLKQRNTFLGRLSKLKQMAISHQQTTPDRLKIVSIKDELEKAHWIRRVGTDNCDASK